MEDEPIPIQLEYDSCKNDRAPDAGLFWAGCATAATSAIGLLTAGFLLAKNASDLEAYIVLGVLIVFTVAAILFAAAMLWRAIRSERAMPPAHGNEVTKNSR
jgi:hypothetical protein